VKQYELMMIKLTEEQQEILRSVKKEDKIKIKAYAGTGKTTTLLQIVKHNPNKNFLIVAFNKSVQKEIQKKIKKEKLKNAVVYTLHSLAYAVVFKNRLYKNKNFKYSTVKKQDILQSIKENLDWKLREIWESDYISSELLNFIYKMFNVLLSSTFAPNPDFTIALLEKALNYDYEAKLLYEIFKNRYVREKREILGDWDWENSFKEKLQKSINLLWEATKEAIEEDGDLKNNNLEDLDISLFLEENENEDNDKNVTQITAEAPKIKYSPEAVIKYLHYTLFTNKLSIKWLNGKKIDYVLVDEAQDVNGVQVGLLNALQKKMKVIIVGDPHQNIYNWRGAVNSFVYYDKEWIEKSLSISFRFENQNIVDFANVILQKVKAEKTPLKLYPKKEIEPAKDLAILTRSNATLFVYLNYLKDIEESGNLKETSKLIVDLKNNTYTGNLEEAYELFVRNIEQNLDKYGAIKIKILRKLNELTRPIINAYFLIKAFKMGDYQSILEQIAKIYPKFVVEEIDRNPEIVASLEDFRIFLETQLMDREMLMAISVVRTLGTKTIWDIIDWLKYKVEKNTLIDVENNKKRANKDIAITLSTIHTSKGLEWDYVLLGEDIQTIAKEIYEFMATEGIEIRWNKFTELLDNIRNMSNKVNPLLDEINLKYVAVTRAKKGLIFYNQDLYYELNELLQTSNPDKYLFNAVNNIQKQKEEEMMDLF
jgi:superfamily I DNA/RNA helicase